MGSGKIKFGNIMNELTQLKARAYDLIAALEQLQRELSAVNNSIAEKSAELQKEHAHNEPGSLDFVG